MNIPRHVSIIMDGNGRWAQARGLPRIAGHRAGIDAALMVVRVCRELGVSYLTLFVFSAENWARPRIEVAALMDLIVEMVRREINKLHRDNVCLHVIGDLSQLPTPTRHELVNGMELTKNNTGMNLIMAVNYGGRAEIVRAARNYAMDAMQNASSIERFDEAAFGRYLYTSSFPDPELIIRTGGEKRISNFLLWQTAYSEFYNTEVLWPDFKKENLIAAIEDFNMRDRRYGKVGK